MKALAVVLVLLLGLLLLVDRVAVGFAEDRVAEQIAEQSALQAAPEVDIAGFPFLSQAIGGRYDDVRIALAAEELDQPAGTRAELVLRGVQVPLSGAISGSVRAVPVDRIDGTATLSYDLLSAQLAGNTTLAPEGDGLRITRTVEVLGQQLPLTAAGTVTLEGSDVVVDVEQATGVGVDVPDPLLAQAVDLLDLRYTVPALPFGLRLTGVTPVEDGVHVGLEATDAVLQQTTAEQLPS